MKFCIDIIPEEFLEKPDYYLDIWKRSGVDSVQLCVATENRRASEEATVKSAELIRAAGFEAALIAVPVGHPCPPQIVNGVNTRLPPGWRVRTGRDGQPEYNSAELTDRMISDVIDYSARYAALGFDTFFMDDDLRSGNLSPLVTGCFCDDCISAFSEREGKRYTRASLLASDEKTLERWCLFQSERVTKLMTELGRVVKKPGIMIMNSGDERHGIDVHALADIPGIQVRVGEQHFFDAEASSITGRVENFAAVTGHLYRLGGKTETYSETTVLNIPGQESRTTTAEHTLSKAYLALTAGVDNIDWMCWKYFDMMADNYRALRQYHAETCGTRAYPVHVARDGFAAQTTYYPDLTATACGLPAAPVFAAEAEGGEVLVLPDHLYDRPEWRAAAEKYGTVLKPAEVKAFLKTTDIPHAETDSPVCLAWIPERNRAAVYNPLETEQTAVVAGHSVKLTPGGAGYVEL